MTLSDEDLRLLEKIEGKDPSSRSEIERSLLGRAEELAERIAEERERLEAAERAEDARRVEEARREIAEKQERAETIIAAILARLSLTYVVETPPPHPAVATFRGLRMQDINIDGWGPRPAPVEPRPAGRRPVVPPLEPGPTAEEVLEQAVRAKAAGE